MKFSHTVAYALQASLHLAREHSREPIPCSRLAAEGNMPERFLIQILRDLVTHGILTSTRGIEGGFSLHRPASEISLLDIIEAVSGPIVSTLPLGDGMPTESVIRIKEALASVTEKSRRQLASIKLAHIVPKPGKQTTRQA